MSQNHEDDFKVCKSMLEAGKSVEHVLQFLKDQDYEMSQSAFFLMKLGIGDGYTVGKIVDQSPVWRDPDRQ